MKIALVTANIGNIDTVIPPVGQSVPYDYFCYTEENLPYSLGCFDNRMKSKWLKFNMHNYLKGYDRYVWIDGRVRITSPTFIEDLKEDFCINRHPLRATIKQEYDFMLDLMINKNKYLNSRYNISDIREEQKIFGSDWPLYMCGVFSYVKGKEFVINNTWEKTLLYSPFDQGIMSFLLFGYNVQHITGFEVGRHNV